MTMTGFTVEESELLRLQWCQAELLRLRTAERDIRVQLVDIEARLDALERARNQSLIRQRGCIAGE